MSLETYSALRTVEAHGLLAIMLYTECVEIFLADLHTTFYGITLVCNMMCFNQYHLLVNHYL